MGEYSWLQAISGSLIAAACLSISFTLYSFLNQRRGAILLFAGFILACGTTHLVSVWNIWHSAHLLEGLMKAIAAVLAVATAFVTIRLGPSIVSDISERKKAADELLRVNEELRRSNTEIEQFAHVASHDLQEPLRMVTSYLQLIERRYAQQLDPKGVEFIAFAVDGAKRMRELIKDLLELSRAGTLATKFHQVDAHSILENAVNNLKAAIEESGATITAEPLPIIVGDPVLLTQVFQNLIANAIKFQKDLVPIINISARNSGGEWIFSVRDNGIGIEPQHRDRIFRIFERLHSSEEYPGSGIGLAITRKIVERHGGKIWVESQPGTGSTFHFSIYAEMANSAHAGS